MTTTPAPRSSCFRWKTALVVFCVVGISAIVPRGLPVLPELARIVIFPGMVADILLSGNVHCGFGNPALDYSVGIGAAWAFWMTLSALINWCIRLPIPKRD